MKSIFTFNPFKDNLPLRNKRTFKSKKVRNIQVPYKNTDMYGNHMPTSVIEMTDIDGKKVYINTDKEGNLKYKTISSDGYPSNITIKNKGNKERVIESRTSNYEGRKHTYTYDITDEPEIHDVNKQRIKDKKK